MKKLSLGTEESDLPKNLEEGCICCGNETVINHEPAEQTALSTIECEKCGVKLVEYEIDDEEVFHLTIPSGYISDVEKFTDDFELFEA